MSGVDYDARGTGLVRVAHDAGAYYFRVANRAVVRALAKLHEVRARRARECPQAPQRAQAASRVASLPPGVVLPYLPAA